MVIIGFIPIKIATKEDGINWAPHEIIENGNEKPKKPIKKLHNQKYIDIDNNLCSIKLKSTSDASFLSNYLLKKKYAIKHYSINKGQLDEVFRQLTNTV